MSKKNNQKNSQQKLDLAKKIALKKSEPRNYARVENVVSFIYRRITDLFTTIFYNDKFSSIFALLIAIVLYFAVNVGTDTTIGVSQATTISNIPVEAVYNSLMYEVEGIPETVSVIVMGDMSDITLQKSQTNSTVACDLTGLTEGTYTIKLEPTNFISRLSVNILDTPTVTVTIKPKTTLRYNISYEYINTNKMDSIYTLEEPSFSTTEVMIRASEDTINNIAFVKALIDVTNVTGSFSQDARVVAYDHNGNIVNCDITPSTVNATVVVSSQYKEVPIVVVPHGNLRNDLAIEEISLDYSVVKLYGPSNVLAQIDQITIPLDISTIDKDTSLTTPLELPSGVNSMSVTKVNMMVKLGEKVSKVIENVNVKWENRVEDFKYQLVNSEDYAMNVVVYGTAKNIESISIEDIEIYVDLATGQPGVQKLPVYVKTNVKYVIVQLQSNKETVEVEVANSK